MLLQTDVSHIKYLEAVKEQLEVRLKGADHEFNVNEALMLNRAGADPHVLQLSAPLGTRWTRLTLAVLRGVFLLPGPRRDAMR